MGWIVAVGRVVWRRARWFMFMVVSGREDVGENHHPDRRHLQRHPRRGSEIFLFQGGRVIVW